jgi:hypothetical protein
MISLRATSQSALRWPESFLSVAFLVSWIQRWREVKSVPDNQSSRSSFVMTSRCSKVSLRRATEGAASVRTVVGEEGEQRLPLLLRLEALLIVENQVRERVTENLIGRSGEEHGRLSGAGRTRRDLDPNRTHSIDGCSVVDLPQRTLTFFVISLPPLMTSR